MTWGLFLIQVKFEVSAQATVPAAGEGSCDVSSTYIKNFCRKETHIRAGLWLRPWANVSASVASPCCRKSLNLNPLWQ